MRTGLQHRALSGLARAAALAGWLLLTAWAPAAWPPSYQWNVGDRLVYERRVEAVPAGGGAPALRQAEQLQFWCLARDGDDVLLLGELIPIVTQQAGPSRGVLLHLGLRGQRRYEPEMLTELADLDPLLDLLPSLPPVLDADGPWLCGPDHLGRQWRYTLRRPPAPDEPAQADFELVDPTGVAATCGITCRGRYGFDTRAGTLVRIEFERRDQRSGERTLAVTRLRRRMHEEPLWCQQRSIEARHYLQRLRVEERVLDDIAGAPDQVEPSLARVDRLWSEFAAGLPQAAETPFRRLAAGRRARLAARSDSHRERARRAREWLGTSAAHWSLQTPEGETLRSEVLRDRVVVECFWSADSLWSLRAFETLRRVQKDLPADGFRIICLNIDADVAAARRAIRNCGRGLTHVLAGPPVGGEPPAELPVFRVLDRQSRVLAVYFGWQPLLAERILALRH